MSRHHMLPPLNYLPPPRPRKIETRKRRINVGDVDEMEETNQTDETAASGRSTPASMVLAQPNFPAIEGSERKPHNPQGRFSEDMLSLMLKAQELE
jgi:hypothetical protein